MHLESFCVLFIISLLFRGYQLADAPKKESNIFNQSDKTVLVVIVAHNKAHTLPYVLQLFESQKYPKRRISLYIRSYRNTDSTADILKDWLALHEEEYDNIDAQFEDNSLFLPEEEYPSPWTEAGANNLIQLKQDSLKFARIMAFDYVWYLDPDVFLNDNFILQRLILAKKPIVAPMLDSVFTYSNFFNSLPNYWDDIKNNHNIFKRKTLNYHKVFMVTSCVLINLNSKGSSKLSFKYPRDELEYIHINADYFALSLSALYVGIPIEVCNENVYGFMVMPMKVNDLSLEMQQVIDIKVKSLEYFPPMSVSPCLQKYLPPKIKKDTMGFDQIYILNLERRPERKERMLQSLDELGVDARIFKSVDGLKLTSSYIKRLGIKPLSEIMHVQLMTMGIVGSFLTKYFVWQDVIKNNFTKVLVFEDDVSFKPNFKNSIAIVQRELSQLSFEWDFIYLYRNGACNNKYKKVVDSDILVKPMFSYSIMAFIITKEGAQKLIDAEPLGKLINTDWFISTMFNAGNVENMKKMFPIRNLKAFSVKSFPVVPTHEEGVIGYVSDTKNSSKFCEAFPDIRYNSEELLKFANTVEGCVFGEDNELYCYTDNGNDNYIVKNICGS